MNYGKKCEIKQEGDKEFLTYKKNPD